MVSERQQQLHNRAESFVTEVTRIINSNNGARATLRRALGRLPHSGQTQTAHRIVAPHLPEKCGQATERAFYAIASMIAAQPRSSRDHDGDKLAAKDGPATEITDPPADETEPELTNAGLGESLGATLGRATATGKVKFDTTEAHLLLLCRQQLHGVHQHLPRLILRLRGELVEIHWARLLVDLADWRYGRDRITKRWLQDFYRTHHAITADRNKNGGNNSDNESNPGSEDQ
ncbi:type I-E CRISPR-associated protein Cse2/CasB [Nocardia sp. NEAU-G5]|uniref:Type I-E CRISPR-associated protein Cse2/CasB n=1 Tax=Nocardia albiluteola TaxID=2842303 RepID=A0ABS6AYP0_9NOCA|nr:type I-E CRISPR-associated protein Cse2/CasB [Nocardia albiluteola]MBU3063157.1 type I-E CRISPR-associated protein Cse2/CasB [Nocardia albiluteola]